MSIIIPLTSIGIIVAIVGIFIRRFRWRSVLLLLICLVIGVAAQSRETDRLDGIAQTAGFQSHQDFLDAEEAGISDPDQWNATRAEREAEARAREAEARELAEQQRWATECGSNDYLSAYILSQDFVRAQLKAPSTARFPNFRAVSVTSAARCRYAVSAYVDAQNSFGAQIRSPYRAVIERDPADDTWRLIELNM